MPFSNQSAGVCAFYQPMLTKLEGKYPMVEIILTMGSTILASLPLIIHSFLCLLVLATWVDRLNTDLQNLSTNKLRETYQTRFPLKQIEIIDISSECSMQSKTYFFVRLLKKISNIQILNN